MAEPLSWGKQEGSLLSAGSAPLAVEGVSAEVLVEWPV